MISGGLVFISDYSVYVMPAGVKGWLEVDHRQAYNRQIDSFVACKHNSQTVSPSSAYRHVCGSCLSRYVAYRWRQFVSTTEPPWPNPVTNQSAGVGSGRVLVLIPANPSSNDSQPPQQAPRGRVSRHHADRRSWVWTRPKTTWTVRRHSSARRRPAELVDFVVEWWRDADVRGGAINRICVWMNAVAKRSTDQHPAVAEAAAEAFSRTSQMRSCTLPRIKQ